MGASKNKSAARSAKGGEAAGGKKQKTKKRKEQEDAELAAEKRPRVQPAWTEQHRRQQKLPTVGDEEADAHLPASGVRHEEGAEHVGKKKAKVLVRMQARQDKKKHKQILAQARKIEKTAAAVKSRAKTKPGEMSQEAKELVEQNSSSAAAQRRLLAIVAERITGSPEKEIELFDVFFILHKSGLDAETKQLALLSAIAVFRDLVPGYRVRRLNETEKGVQRSKKVMTLEQYEVMLLHTYRRLLPDLEAAMKHHPAATAPALAALVRAAYDFNYRERLIATAVRHANSELDDVRPIVVAGLREMVEGDRRLEASKEVVIAIGRLAQAAASRKAKAGEDEGQAAGETRSLHPELLKVLLQLPIGRAEEASLNSDPAGELLEDEMLRRGLAEASIHQTVEALRKAEAVLLYEVFVVYLRILRQRNLHRRDMLSVVLTGLGRWGQQVNLELLLEILQELRLTVQESINQGDGVVALQGLNCALVLLSGPSQALLTDVGWLADCMTGALELALPAMYSTHSESAEWPPPRCFWEEDGRLQASARELALALEVSSAPALVLKCLEAALKCPQGYGRASDSALATLIERLFLLAAASDPHVAVPILKESAMLLRKHYRLHTLLDAEGGIFGLGGVVNRAVSVAWHLQPLAFSLMPELARASRSLPLAIRKRTASIGDQFPARENETWLASEFARHVCATALAPAPPKKRTHSGPRPAFLTASELAAICGAGVSRR